MMLGQQRNVALLSPRVRKRLKPNPCLGEFNLLFVNKRELYLSLDINLITCRMGQDNDSTVFVFFKFQFVNKLYFIYLSCECLQLLCSLRFCGETLIFPQN